MIGVEIDFDDSQFIKFTEVLTPARIQVAINRAVRKTALWVRTHLLRKIKDEGIRRKIIVHRVRLYNKGWRDGVAGGTAVKVWFGINAVEADRISKPIKMSKGYRVGKWQFPIGFMPKSRPGKLYERTTSKRLPIERSKVEIDEEANAAFEEIAGQVPDRMRTLAIQELGFEMHKAMGTI